VLLNETIDSLKIVPNGIYVDGTAGGGGLSINIAKKLNSYSGKLICIDHDPDAIEECNRRLSRYKNIILINENFVKIKKILNNLNIDKVDGVVLDLGVSSHQLDEAQRGFSYKKEAKLDMRMSKSGLSAFEVVNKCDPGELLRIIKVYGEEKYSKNIANAIFLHRKRNPIESTIQLANIISDCVPFSYKKKGHPAKKTFQAIRIYVNSELENLEKGLDSFIDLLKKNGRLCVIAFHSLEDRIVKHKMFDWSRCCKCPPDFPVCTCGQVPKAAIITKRPILPSDIEIKENSRSRSAKLRVCQKIV
jgi:16S rRNA (cytosine1402-N4)-methyltransferase